MMYRVAKQGCNKCIYKNECTMLDVDTNDVTMTHKSKGDVVMVSVFNCDKFEVKIN